MRQIGNAADRNVCGLPNACGCTLPRVSATEPSSHCAALYERKDLAYALGATIALIAVCALAYAFLGLFGGGFLHLLRELTAVATDAKRLQSQGTYAWIIAILRGCLLVPLFEEVLFRGLLLCWLNQHMRFTFALLIQAVLFAAMHVYPFALPYTFLFGIATGYVRRKTGSTVNTILMHVVNNLILLRLGLYFFGH